MASAATVAADAARSPLPDHEINEQLGTIGTIRARRDSDNNNSIGDHLNALAADDFEHANHDGPDNDVLDSEDSDTITKKRRGHKIKPQTTSSVQDSRDEELGVHTDRYLFGSDTENEKSPIPRRLSAEELATEDEEDDNEAHSARPVDELEATGDEDEENTRQVMVMNVEFGRQPGPQPSDGELYLFKVPKFLSIEPRAFQPQTFQPPTTDHHSQKQSSHTFSAYNTAMTTLRWRRSPSDRTKLQSNARILRWSDGSLTLQLASDSTRQYLLPGNTLAPPQLHASKPTPTSVKSTLERQKRMAAGYTAEQDSFTYLVVPSTRSGFLRIGKKFTVSLTVQPPSDAPDDALERLQHSMAAAAGTALGDEGEVGLIKITEDPELAKRKAEAAEKERTKAQRRREAQEARERDRTGRTPGKRAHGMSGPNPDAAADVHDDPSKASAGGTRLPGLHSRRSKPRRQNRGEIYSDEEEAYGRRGHTREDEYDEEDDFVARSDEEEEIVVDDEDDDDGIIEASRQHQKDRIHGRSETKRERGEDESSSKHVRDSPVSRAKRRRIIDEEDEDE